MADVPDPLNSVTPDGKPNLSFGKVKAPFFISKATYEVN